MEIEKANVNDIKLRARVTWSLIGDENSSYFNGAINIYLAYNKINCYNNSGEWNNK